eukprot:6490569-Amphidinium_carterae.5
MKRVIFVMVCQKAQHLLVSKHDTAILNRDTFDFKGLHIQFRRTTFSKNDGAPRACLHLTGKTPYTGNPDNLQRD